MFTPQSQFLLAFATWHKFEACVHSTFKVQCINIILICSKISDLPAVRCSGSSCSDPAHCSGLCWERWRSWCVGLTSPAAHCCLKQSSSASTTWVQLRSAPLLPPITTRAASFPSYSRWRRRAS